MSNKLIIPIILALSLSAICSYGFAQLYQVNKVNKSTAQVSVNISSKSATSSISQARVESGVSVSGGSSVKVESVKSETMPEIESVKSSSPISGLSPNLKLLTSENLPQYVKDYISCNNKEYKGYEGLDKQNFVTNGLEITYFCPPPAGNCSYKVYVGKAWKCDIYKGQMEYPGDVCGIRFGVFQFIEGQYTKADERDKSLLKSMLSKIKYVETTSNINPLSVW